VPLPLLPSQFHILSKAEEILKCTGIENHWNFEDQLTEEFGMEEIEMNFWEGT
jgi:hypothetical protein